MQLNIHNYKQATKGLVLSKLPAVAKETHKEFEEFADFYSDDRDIKEMLDNHFKIVQPYLIAKPKRKVAVKKKKVTSTKKRAAKRKTATKVKRKANEVALLPLEIKIIRRYLNMHSKKVTERQVSLLYKVIQKAAAEKTIRKSSKYAGEIVKIGNDLASTYKQMNSTCVFEVPTSLYGKLKKISESYGVTPAVALIKRFVNLYGTITVEKAKRLLTSIRNAKNNEKVTRSDKSYTKLNQVQKHLESYLDSDKLMVTKVQLNGLKGIANVGK